MKKMLSIIASAFAMTGGFFVLFALTLASDKMASPFAFLGSLCFLVSLCISHWAEKR